MRGISKLVVLVAAVVMAAGCSMRSESTKGGGAKGVPGSSYFVNLITPPLGGIVTSDVGGIDCGASARTVDNTVNPPQYVFAYYPSGAGLSNQCGQTRFDWGQPVVLTASPQGGNVFYGWAGDCSGAGTCSLSAGADKSVFAIFGPAGGGHTNFTSPALHGPAALQSLAGAAGSLPCARCHGASLDGQGIAPSCNTCHAQAGWASGASGVNCTFCHGTSTPAASLAASVALAAPPDDVQGRQTGTQGPAVGAHQIHLQGSSLAAPVACTECHTDHTPPAGATFAQLGAHVDGVAQVVFGPLAGQSTTPVWNGTTLRCATYCHGATLDGGGAKTPAWGQLDGTARACTSCHGLPPLLKHDGTGHPTSTLCGTCHAGYTSTSVVAATHVNGHVETIGSQACGSCHAIPPATMASGGLHPSNPACGSCHAGYTNSTVNTSLHLNGKVDVVPLSCTACHGDPPPPYVGAPSNHPLSGSTTCSLCHGAGYTSSTVNAATHANGTVNVITWDCTTCHGTSGVNAAPPASVASVTGRANAVGAHQAHLAGVTSGGVRLSAAFPCATCHAVPSDLQHVTGNAAVVALTGQGPLAALSLGSYDSVNLNCSTYCHGTSLTGGSNKMPAWNSTLTGGACDACHAAPPATRGHVGVTSAVTGCAKCHRDTVAADGSIIVVAGASKHLNGVVDENVSTGDNNCATCHGALMGDATQYHHVMGTLADGWIGYPSNAQPTSSADKACIQCHVDHDLFTGARGANLRADILTVVPANSDASLCTSCHGSTQTKDQAGQKNDGTLATYAIDATAFWAGGHSYLVGGSISGAGLDFQVACTKCHNSDTATQYQDGAYTFGLHTSVDRRLRALLGRTTMADDVAEDFCYRCHSNTTDAVGGAVKATSLQDWYGAVAMPNGSTGIFSQMAGAAAMPQTNTDTLFFKPAVQETPSGGPGSSLADGTASVSASALYLTNANAVSPPAGYLDTAGTYDTSVLRQKAMTVESSASATSVAAAVTLGTGARFDKVAQFISPPVARAFSWSSGNIAFYNWRGATATTNNCYFRYAVYKLDTVGATTAIVTAANGTTAFPATAAGSNFNMALTGSPSFAVGDRILVEVGVYKNNPTTSGTCTVSWGNTASDFTRITLPATSDSTYPEFNVATPVTTSTANWVARSMSPNMATAAAETITGSGTVNAYQDMLWKRATFTSPQVTVATTLPAAAYTLTVYDYRGASGSSNTNYLRYRIVRWNADGTQGPDIVPWQTYTSSMGSSTAAQTVTIPASATTATSLSVGDRIVTEVEAQTLALTASVTNNSTIAFGAGASSSLVLPAKVVFDYASPAAPATSGHLGSLYTAVHRPNPAEETLAYLATAKHAECSDCHDPHGAKRGNQSDGGTLTSATTLSITDTNQNWITNAWVGYYVDVPSVSTNNRAQITGNTATTLTLATALTSAPAVNAAYRISMRANGGAVSSATANSLTDSQSAVGGAKAWTTNLFAGWYVRIVLGTGMGQTKQVASNTATSLTLSGTWDVTPDTTSRYVVDKLPGVLTGAGGVNLTAWDSGTPSAWGEAKTFSPAAGSSTGIPDATTQWQVCFKCHSGANTGLTTWKSTWSDLGAEFNPRNQSYHPIVAPSVASSTSGYGNSQIAANTLVNGWKAGDMMYCSDCHGNNDASYGASQGPHASAVKFVLRGPNTTWPTQADGLTRWTIGSGTPWTANQGTSNGLFCLNCHALSSGVHGESHHNGAACSGCHLVIPHGGKVKRLMRTTNAAAPYIDVAGTATTTSTTWPTGVALLKAYGGGSSDNSSSCGANCTTRHNITVNSTTAPVNAW